VNTKRVLILAKKELSDLLHEKVYILNVGVQLVVIVLLLTLILALGQTGSQESLTPLTPGEELGVVSRIAPGVRTTIGVIGNPGLLVPDPKTKIVEFENLAEARKDLAEKRLDAILVLPAGYIEKLSKGEQVRFQVISNPSNLKSTFATTKIEFMAKKIGEEFLDRRIEKLGLDWGKISKPVVVNILYANPENAKETGVTPTTIELVIGLLVPVAVIMPLVVSMTTISDSIVGEKERKTFEPLLSSPITRKEIALGKMLPVACLATIQAVVWLSIPLITGIPMVNTPLLVLEILIMALGLSGLGVAASAYANNTRESTLLTTITAVIFTISIISPIPIGEISEILPGTLIVRTIVSTSLDRVVTPLLATTTWSFGALLLGLRLLDKEENIRL